MRINNLLLYVFPLDICHCLHGNIQAKEHNNKLNAEVKKIGREKQPSVNMNVNPADGVRNSSIETGYKAHTTRSTPKLTLPRKKNIAERIYECIAFTVVLGIL